MQRESMLFSRTIRKVDRPVSQVMPMLLAVAVFALLQSCASPAHIEVDRAAGELGLHRSVEQGAAYKHVLYQPGNRSGKDKLHVYIEGDGVAWRWRRVISSDPTPRNPLMLRLMSTDSANTLYVGRPCYFGLAPNPACNSDVWTYSRFSDDVVSSMARIVRRHSAAFNSIVLIGHSGGGALALLIAEQLDNVDAVVTVAGNLDTDKWVDHHGYTALYGSLNPAIRPSLPETVRQLHLLASEDEVIPPVLVDDWIARQPSAQRWVFEGFNHSCCWEKSWSDVLHWINGSKPDAV